jgi:hypothetical protein
VVSVHRPAKLGLLKTHTARAGLAPTAVGAGDHAPSVMKAKGPAKLATASRRAIFVMRGLLGESNQAFRTGQL